MFEFFQNLDRRWIFLLMFLSVALPILFQAQFPEKPSGLAEAVFDEVEALEEGDRIMLAFDYDPASEGELGPMATAFVRHACEKKLKIYFLALWPVGPLMIDDNIKKVIETDFPEMVYGTDYMNLGFKAGNEGVIKVVITDLRQLYTTDSYGTSTDNYDELPMMEGVKNIQQMDLVCNVSAGYPGTKEWVQYAVTRFPDEIRMVAGCTGVQAPLLYPYIPQQLPGLLGAIKGASEYEKLVLDKYGQSILTTDEDGREVIPGKYLEGQRRMGPQLIAHVLMILFIIAGNIIFFIQRSREGQA
ncbi:MAG: hypothetical protein ACYTG1_02075 [Planctomycetota bacterium]|jgi:hypothetical protein